MDAMHSLLKRQLKRQFGDGFAIPAEWQAFIDSVNNAYREFDADREMLEHSLDLSSQELLDANTEMRAVFQAIPDLVFRLDVYVGERDTYGIGFSDNVIFRKQYYVRVLLDEPFQLYLHTAEDFAAGSAFASPMTATDTGWLFDVKGTGFEATFAIEIDKIPEAGPPEQIKLTAKA